MSNKLVELGVEVIDLIEKYNGVIQPYEIANQLIYLATHMLLTVAPNELLAIKTVMASVEIGINAYQEDQGEK